MNIIQQPDALSLSGNIKEFKIGTSDIITFTLKQGNTEILSQSYTPGQDNIVTVNVRDIVHARLSYLLQDNSSIYIQPDIAGTFTAVIAGSEITFRVVRAGVDRLSDSATNFLTQNFMTWQPSVKPVTYYSPEFLTYYATQDVNVQLKAYFTDDTGSVTSEQVITFGVLAAGNAYTIPLQYAIVAGKFSGEFPAYYDVWIENPVGQRLTYIQRYYASSMLSEQEQWILFENSLGGLDTFRAYGTTDFTAEHTHNIAEIDEVATEYRVDTTRKFQKSTGHLDGKQRQWLLDFFPSPAKYIYTASYLRTIVLLESNVNYTDRELPSNYTFTYRYADARPLLNLPRTDVPSEVLNITVPEVGSFTVPPRLVEFPRLSLSEGALFPVQNPYSEEWSTTTIDALVNYVNSWLLQNGSSGGVGHTHVNHDLLQQISYAMGYLLVASQKINAGQADEAMIARTLKTIKFIPGFTGIGGLIDENGDAEFDSVFIRRKLIVPEIAFNSIQVYLGDKWRAPGGGIIKSIDVETRTVELDLQDGQIGAVAIGDICMGIFHSLKSEENATADIDDSKGNRTYAGFITAYFTITEVIGSRNEQFRYQLRPESERWPDSYHPRELMHFVCYGNFINPDRQTSVYETRTYTRLLWKQNTWEINAANIAQQLGDLSNMTVHGINMNGYSAYLNNIYLTGTIKQVKPDGTTAPIPNYLPDWKIGDKVNYYDEVSHEGGLWLCVNESGTNTIPGKDNSDWVLVVASGEDGKNGTSVTSAPEWRSDETPYAANTILAFAGKVWISNKETTEAPYSLITNKDGDYILQTQDGGKTFGYILTGEINSGDWDLLIDPGSVFKGVEDTDVFYAISSSNTIVPTVGWKTTAPVWENGKYIWSKTVITYTDGSTDETSPACITGGVGATGNDGVGVSSIVEQYYLSSSATNLIDGNWSTDRPTWKDGWYIWTRSVISYTDSTSSTTEAICVTGGKGEDGNGISSHGEWHSNLTVPYLGTVRMGGATWLCINKNGTTNSPMWTVTNAMGDHLVQTQDSGKTFGYILTGEINSSEYTLVASDGTDGQDGNDGIDGRDGQDGKDGDPGIQGCILIKSEWGLNNEYRNDEALASGTRYINIALVRDNSLQTGWQAYKCLKTHTSTTTNAPGNTEFWEAFGLNVNAIFTSLIIAKDAILEFVQGNQFLIKNNQGNVIGGFSGEGYIWMGGPSPSNATNVIRAAGSGHLAAGNILWDEAGNVEMIGDFVGKITTRKNGIRMVLDPESISFKMYDASNNELIRIGFTSEGTDPGVRLRQYSGSAILSEITLMGVQMNQYMVDSTGATLESILDPQNGLRFLRNGVLTKQYVRT